MTTASVAHFVCCFVSYNLQTTVVYAHEDGYRARVRHVLWGCTKAMERPDNEPWPIQLSGIWWNMIVKRCYVDQKCPLNSSASLYSFPLWLHLPPLDTSMELLSHTLMNYVLKPQNILWPLLDFSLSSTSSCISTIRQEKEGKPDVLCHTWKIFLQQKEKWLGMRLQKQGCWKNSSPRCSRQTPFHKEDS